MYRFWCKRKSGVNKSLRLLLAAVLFIFFFGDFKFFLYSLAKGQGFCYFNKVYILHRPVLHSVPIWVHRTLPLYKKRNQPKGRFLLNGAGNRNRTCMKLPSLEPESFNRWFCIALPISLKFL